MASEQHSPVHILRKGELVTVPHVQHVPGMEGHEGLVFLQDDGAGALVGELVDVYGQVPVVELQDLLKIGQSHRAVEAALHLQPQGHVGIPGIVAEVVERTVVTGAVIWE